MLSSGEVHRVGESLVVALSEGSRLAPITSRMQHFDQADAYEVLRGIAEARVAQGWVQIGRKIGFTNRTSWERYGVHAPMWAHMWDRTVEFATDDGSKVSLDRLVQPRIEPEIVFKLRGPIPIVDDPVDILSNVEWLAPGFEIVQCLYPNWVFTVPDAIAAFGFHGRLVVGTPVAVNSENRESLATALHEFEVTLSRDTAIVDRGTGANVLASPALALASLARVVADQPRQPPLRGGEVITTGTITDAWTVRSGERWTSDYGSLGLRGLCVTFA